MPISKMTLKKRFKTSITGAMFMLCNAITSFVAHFADSNGNHFSIVNKVDYLWELYICAHFTAWCKVPY